MSAKQMPDENQPPKQLRMVLPQLVNPVYSNVARIAHMPAEMVFDFGRVLPGDKFAAVVARVVMSPLSAKLLQRALSENLAKYESTYGEIKVPQQTSLADQLFKPFAAPENAEEEPPEE